MSYSQKRSLVIVAISVVVGILLAFVGSMSTSAQSAEPEMWAYGNMKTGEIAVVMVMDMESPTSAEMIHSDFAEVLVDEVMLPGYTEEKVSSKNKDVPKNAECRMFVGETEAFEGDGSLMLCLDGSEIYVVAGNAPDSVLWGFIDDLYKDGEPTTPKGYTDLTDAVN